MSSPASRSATARLFRNAPDGPFSLLKLWNRAEAAGRLFGLVHDGDWFHVGTPQALAEAERVLRMKGVFTIGIDRRFADELAARRAGRARRRSAGAGRHADPAADPPLGARAARGLPARVGRQAHPAAAHGAARRSRRRASGTTCAAATARARPAARHRAAPSARRCWRSWSRPSRTTTASRSRRSAAQALKLARELGRPARRARHRRRAVRQARRPGRRQLRQPLAPHAEVPRHRRRSTGRRSWPSAARSTRSTGAPARSAPRPRAGASARPPRR